MAGFQRSIGLRAAPTSSSRRTRVVCGAVFTISGFVAASSAMDFIASMKRSHSDLDSDSVGSIFRGLPHSPTIGEDVRQSANQHAEISAEGFYAADAIRTHRLKRQPAAFFSDQDGHRPEGLEDFLHRYGAGAGTAAAVWRRKCV